MSPGLPSRDRSEASLLARGAPIGRYLVLGLVGRGAMGDVYAAYDPELDRKVAVKLLNVNQGLGPALAEQKARLLREAQAIARLSHPNVVVVHDVGSFEDQVFVAMSSSTGTRCRTGCMRRRAAGARSWTSSSRPGAVCRRHMRPVWCIATSRARTSCSPPR